MQGRPWKEITEEWSRLTGRKPGGSSLSVRYIKLKEKFARMGDRDVSSVFVPFSDICGLAAMVVELCLSSPFFRLRSGNLVPSHFSNCLSYYSI